MRRAHNRASIAIVPEPHIGSISGLTRSQPAIRNIAAASVSLIGASPASVR